MASAKWVKKLTKREVRHLAEGSATGRPTIQSLKANLDGQRKLGIQCFECEAVARKLSIAIATSEETTTMTNCYYISSDPQFYGSDVTDEEAVRYAQIVAEHASAAFPAVEFDIVCGPCNHRFDDEELLSSVRQTIDDNWADWIADCSASPAP
jgi:hypothetical protein